VCIERKGRVLSVMRGVNVCADTPLSCFEVSKLNIFSPFLLTIFC